MIKKVLIYFSLMLFISCGNLSVKNTHSTPFNNTINKNNYTQLSTINNWHTNQISKQHVFQEGIVYKILQDDNEGSRHQKFILKLNNQKTILISHNIDLSTRIINLKPNDSIIFFGQYEWNKKGGVVHFTHKDPNKKHIDGYLIHNKIKYD